jgi:demethylmenaquinone methyltransferase / 2-methoxy-6-polyprenyl-1,4-benzoquinol methylase
MALRDLDPHEHLGDPERKPRYVRAVFDTVAPSYDRFTRRFSFGMDAGWKRCLAGWTAHVVRPGDLVADCACGTGDVALAVRRALGGSDRGQDGWAGVRLVGIDSNAAMLGAAKRRLASVPVLRGDLVSLPLADGAAAAVTVAYGFRNVADVGAAMAEVARVIRPGGWLFDLDFFQPEHRAWRRLFLWYLHAAGRAAGIWWHREPEAYGYLARSLDRWVTPPEFRSLLEQAGFRVDRAVRHLGGAICLHGALRMTRGSATI